MLGVCVLAEDKYVILQTEESDDTPTNFKEGLPQYVTLTDDKQNSLGQFLLCTSCTISYMFGTPPVNVTAEKISFREHADTPIEVYFEERTLVFSKTALPSQNSADKTFSVTMEIGIIDKKYANKTYFNWPK